MQKLHFLGAVAAARNTPIQALCKFCLPFGIILLCPPANKRSKLEAFIGTQLLYRML